MLTIDAKPSTREAILDACDRIMARYGFRKMTLDDLAKEAGLAKRTIYLYFDSKQEVGLSSIGRVVEKVHLELTALASSPDPAEARLRAMLRSRVMARVVAVQEYHEGLDELFEAVRPAYMERRRLAFDIESGLIKQVLEEGQAAGRFRSIDAERTARSLLLATNAFLPYSLSVRELGRVEEIAERLEAMIDLLLHGLFQAN